MLLNFNDDVQDTDDEIIEINKVKDKGKETVTDEDLRKPFKEVFKCPFTRACAKDPTEISKIIWKANESLPNFKERWISVSNGIPNVPELMQISSSLSGSVGYNRQEPISRGFCSTKGPPQEKH
ncbi:hypothetical protein Tco_1238806 [Tanacetum coccineum]